jgi:hypothetical protein
MELMNLFFFSFFSFSAKIIKIRALYNVMWKCYSTMNQRKCECGNVIAALADYNILSVLEFGSLKGWGLGWFCWYVITAVDVV